MPELNADGVSVKGCSIIYAPRGQALEYAPLSANLYRGAFASTLTSLDPHFSRKWERGAADPDDRISTLREFHERGIFTWVSLEPTLDVEASLDIVDATQGFVDLYKVGRVNYIGLTKTTDWQDYTVRMIEKLIRLEKKHYIKRDLQKYLPDGYHNPLRVPQHH